jgi:hypothetical protein
MEFLKNIQKGGVVVDGAKVDFLAILLGFNLIWWIFKPAWFRKIFLEKNSFSMVSNE